MAHGSFIALYLKDSNDKLSDLELRELKREYAERHKEMSITSSKSMSDVEALSMGVPLMLEKGFKHDSGCQGRKSRFEPYYSSIDGSAMTKLISFSFDSMFDCLKDFYGLTTSYPSKSDAIVSHEDAKQMLVACNYALSKHYDKEFEKIMMNPFVDSLGNGLSFFNSRFATGQETSCPDGMAEWGIDNLDKEHESSLRTLIACLEAYFRSDDILFCTKGQSIEIVYSVWG